MVSNSNAIHTISLSTVVLLCIKLYIWCFNTIGGPPIHDEEYSLHRYESAASVSDGISVGTIWLYNRLSWIHLPVSFVSLIVLVGLVG